MPEGSRAEEALRLVGGMTVEADPFYVNLAETVTDGQKLYFPCLLYTSSAKALGCGVPVGAFMMTEKVAQHSLTAGDHGTTYGGNPLACAAVEKVLDLFEEDHIIEHVLSLIHI